MDTFKVFYSHEGEAQEFHSEIRANSSESAVKALLANVGIALPEDDKLTVTRIEILINGRWKDIPDPA